MRLEALVAETASNPSSEPREQPLLVYQTGRGHLSSKPAATPSSAHRDVARLQQPARGHAAVLVCLVSWDGDGGRRGGGQRIAAGAWWGRRTRASMPALMIRVLMAPAAHAHDDAM